MIHKEEERKASSTQIAIELLPLAIVTLTLCVYFFFQNLYLERVPPSPLDRNVSPNKG